MCQPLEQKLEILIIVFGTPGQRPRTFSVASWTETVVIVRIKSVNTENNHTKYVQAEELYHNTFCFRPLFEKSKSDCRRDLLDGRRPAIVSRLNYE
jgi:hypothetical protein